MINDHFLISFNYPLAEDTFIFVKAEAMYNAANDVFLVGNFRSQRGELNLKLPPIEIKKLQASDEWTDSTPINFPPDSTGTDTIERTPELNAMPRCAAKAVSCSRSGISSGRASSRMRQYGLLQLMSREENRSIKSC